MRPVLPLSLAALVLASRTSDHWLGTAWADDGPVEGVPATVTVVHRADAPAETTQVPATPDAPTREFVGSAYINRMKRQVNSYWSQNLDALPPTVRLSKPSYTTVVSIVVAADGSLVDIQVTTACGLAPLDDAVVSAFRSAAPFAAPPADLVRRDGRVYLDDLSFTVDIGVPSPAGLVPPPR